MKRLAVGGKSGEGGEYLHFYSLTKGNLEKGNIVKKIIWNLSLVAEGEGALRKADCEANRMIIRDNQESTKTQLNRVCGS